MNHRCPLSLPGYIQFDKVPLSVKLLGLTIQNNGTLTLMKDHPRLQNGLYLLR